MKELVGVAQDRIQFLNNLNVKKYWRLELENVVKKLKENDVEALMDTMWRLVVLEWNNITTDNLVYFIQALNNCKTTKKRVEWYNLVIASEYAGNIIFMNQVKKDLLSSLVEIRTCALKLAGWGEDQVWLDLQEIIEKELESKNEEIRIAATSAYFQIIRQDKGDSRKILKKLVDKSPKVMKVALKGIQEFSLYKQVDIRQGLLYIFKQVPDLIVKIRILQILENFKHQDLEVLFSLKNDKDVGFNVKRVLLKQGIYDLEEIRRDLESLNSEKEKKALFLVLMLPLKDKYNLLEHVKKLKDNEKSLTRKLSYSILSEIGDLEDLKGFFRFWEEFKEMLDEKDCMKNVKNWISRDFSDLEKIKGLMISIRLSSDPSRLECFDLVLRMFDQIVQDRGQECLGILVKEIQKTDVLENNIARLYLILLERFTENDLLVKLIVDCVFKSSNVVLQGNFVSLLKKKTSGSNIYNIHIQRLLELETNDDLVLKSIQNFNLGSKSDSLQNWDQKDLVPES